MIITINSTNYNKQYQINLIFKRIKFKFDFDNSGVAQW